MKFSPPLQSVKQQTTSDCGLACVAMVSTLSLEHIHAQFQLLGKFAKHGKDRPWATNTQDLVDLAQSVNTPLRQFKFSEWANLPPVAIVKVNRRNRQFHWVVCEWTDIYGPKTLLIHEPYCGQYFPFTADEHLERNISTIYQPFGRGLRLC